MGCFEIQSNEMKVDSNVLSELITEMINDMPNHH